MRAAVWHGYKDIRIEEAAMPTPGPGQVVVEVAWAGICGTDRHEYVGPNFIPTSKPHRLTGRTAPLTLGHEFSGVVSAVGEGVTNWKPGDRVSANGTLCCNTCEMCKTGKYNICEKLGFLGVSTDGAFADYVAVDAARLFKVPDNVSLRHAILAEPLACGIHATNILGDMTGKNVVVIGPGIIGIGCFLAVKLAGAGKVLVTGHGDARRALIEENGGIYIDTAASPDLNAALLAHFGGLADVSYECVGIQGTLDASIGALKPGGKLMVMGVFEEKPVFPMNDFQEGERQLFTSQAHLTEIGVALTYMSQGKIDAEPLTTREVTLDTLVTDGFEELIQNGPAHIKVALQIGNLS